MTKKVEATVVVSEQETRVVNQEGSGSGLTEELQRLLLKSLTHITTGQLGEELAKLEEKKARGNLSKDDLPILNQLGEILNFRKSHIQTEVAKVFGLAAKGDKVSAERLATKLINDEVDKLPANNKLPKKTLSSLRLLARTGIDSTALLSAGELNIKTKGPQAEAKLVRAYRAVERGLELEANVETVTGAKEIPKRSGLLAEEASKIGVKNLSLEIDKAIIHNRKKVKVPFDREKFEKEAKRELKRRLYKKRGGKELEELLVTGPDRIAVLSNQVANNKDAKGRELLSDYANELNEGLKTLREDKIRQALKVDEKYRFDVKTPVKMKIGNWELGLPQIPRSATKNERLRKVLEIVNTGEDSVWTKEQRILLVADVMGGISIERATAIWEELEKWDAKYSSFAEHIEDVRSDVDKVVRPPVKEKTEEEKLVEQYKEMNNRSRGYKSRGAGKRGLIEAGPNDEDTKLNEYGRLIQDLLGKEYELKIEDGVDSNGKPKYRSQTNSEYWNERNAQGYTVPPGYNRSVELSIITDGRKYKDIPEEERAEISEKVRNAISDLIGRIQATEDSSRAPNNQPLSWEVNELMSWLDSKEDAGFRSLMQARLSSYDQSTILGSIGKKDQFEQVASFIPREWVAILQKDKTYLGKFIDVDGRTKQYELRSQNVYAELEDMMPGSSDRENTWYVEMRKPDDMELVGLAKRRFMAYLLGKQRGIEFTTGPDGSFTLVDNPENLRKASSMFGDTELNIFVEVGLGKDGNFMTDEEYAKYEKYDLFKKYQSFINQSLTRKEVELRGMALEKGQMLNQGVNAFRKMYGWEQLNYTASKFMGMTSSRGDVRDGQVVGGVDDKWRSLPAWKLMSKADSGEYYLIKPLSDAFDEAMPNATKEQKEKFFIMFEHLAYLPERFYLGRLVNQEEHGYGGELRSTSEVRHMFDDEWAEVKKYFNEMDGSLNFDWKPILESMQVPGLERANVKGEAGLKMFCDNYSLDELIDYNRLPQNFWVDFISYSGYSAKNWDLIPNLVVNMADPKLQTPFVDGVRGYDDGAANATLVEFTAKTLKEVSPDPTGYMSWGDKEGKQTTKKWKIAPGDTSEVEYAHKFGFRVLTDGRVVDRNGRFIARPMRVSALKNVVEKDGEGNLKIASVRDLLNTVKGWGSPYVARARSSPSWEDKRDYVFKSLRDMKITDEKVWRDVHARFNASMYFGVQIEPHEQPDMKTIVAKLKQQPWKIALLPYTIIRGLYTDAPIDLASIIAAWNPIGKQVGRIFEV